VKNIDFSLFFVHSNIIILITVFYCQKSKGGIMKIEDVINRGELSERLDGDMELFRELAELFFDDSRKLMDNIQEAIREGSEEKLRKSAHTIKGSVSNFSAQAPFDAAYDLENIGRKGEMDKAQACFDVLKGSIEKLREAMELLVKEDSL